jgi:hypothetical protein
MAWKVRDEAWHRTDVRYCDVTGQLLPKRYWSFDYEGRTYDVMDERCEAILRGYLAHRQHSHAGSETEPPAADSRRRPGGGARG